MTKGQGVGHRPTKFVYLKICLDSKFINFALLYLSKGEEINQLRLTAVKRIQNS